MKLSEVNSVYLKIMLFFFQIVLGLVRELKMSFKNVILRCMILSKKKKEREYFRSYMYSVKVFLEISI